jgi:hypothetical protein
MAGNQQHALKTQHSLDAMMQTYERQIRELQEENKELRNVALFPRT